MICKWNDFKKVKKRAKYQSISIKTVENNGNTFYLQSVI